MLSKFLLRSNKLALLIFIILAHVFILTKLIYFPYPELFVYPYLTNQGLKPYSQILDQHFPGLTFLPINLDNLGMNNEVIARIWSISIVVMTHLLLFLICSKIFKNAHKALIVNLLYLIWQPFFEGWVLWIDSFLPLFLLPAFYFSFRKNFFLTGIFLGLGIVFKQVLIPLSVLLFFYIFWQNRSLKKASLFLMGLIGPIGLMSIYLVSIGVIKDFWYWTVIFNLTVFAQYGRKLPFLAGMLRIGFVTTFSMPILFLKDKKLAGILIIFLVGSLAAIFARFDFVHFQPSLPFVLIATVAAFNALWERKSIKIAVAGYILVTIWWLSIFYKGHLSNQVLFFEKSTKEVATKIKQYTSPGDKIFIFGSVPHLYQMSQTKPAGDVFVFQFPWFLQVVEDRILAGIIKDQPQIVVADRMVEIEGNKITNFANKIDQYILENYEKIDNVGDTEILRRK